MDKSTTTTEAQVEQPAPASPTKKSYAPPAIIHRAPLEATAGACGASPPGKMEGDILCTTLAS